MAGNKSKQTEEEEHFPWNWKKDFRIGSPQRVFRAVRDIIEDLGYANPKVSGLLDKDTGGLYLKGSAISDTATFKGQVRGEREVSRGRHKGYMSAGIILVVLGVGLALIGVANEEIPLGAGAVVPLILGIIFLAIASRVSKAIMLAKVEGEAYKATAKMTEREQELDVVADVRLSVHGKVGIFRGGTEMKHETAQDRDQKIIETDFAEMCKKVEAVLPAGVMKASRLK